MSAKETELEAACLARGLARAVEGLISIAKPDRREELIADALGAALLPLYRQRDRLIDLLEECAPGLAAREKQARNDLEAKSLVFISNSPSGETASAGSVQDDGTGIAANNSTDWTKG